MTDLQGRPSTVAHHKGLALWWRRALTLLFLLFGLPIAAGGAWLLALGGSWYYLPAGLALLLTGLLLWRGDLRALWLYLATWVVTLAWAYGEVGVDGWALVPRVVAPSVLLLLLLTVLPQLAPRGRRLVPLGAVAGAFVVALLAGLLLPGQGAQTMPRATAVATAAAPVAPPAAPTLVAGEDWPVYGGSMLATRYSPLQQITADNVDQLDQVWRYRSGDMPSAAAEGRYSPENTPLEIDGRLYSCTAKNIIVALDAASGRELWRYDPKVADAAIPYGATCRGVAYFVQSDAPAGQACATRILEGTLDARLIAVDAADGKPCADFGQAGAVDLNEGIGQTVPGWYAVTAPPTIVRGIAVLGAQVKDGQAEDAPSGVIRGYDAVTGELRWAWDMGHPERQGAPPAGETYTRGTPNMWTVAAADPQLGYVYIPLGNSAVDYWGGNRTDFENEYSSSLVALDATTGKEVWHFQTVHYDLWDYDLGSQPTLVDLPVEGGSVPAIVLPSKQGQIYVLDRRTGESLFPVEERPVPGGGVEPENLAKTQPYSGYAHLDQPPLQESDMWGMSPVDQLWCRIQFRRASYEGEYTAPTADRAYIEYPGYNGGSDWGSVAVDPVQGILVANYNDMPNYNWLIPRAKADAMGIKPIDEGGSSKNAEGEGDAQAGSPYAIHVNAGWRLGTGLLCKQPPYGRIRAIDLASGRTLWDHPLGDARNNGPFGLPSLLPIEIGTPNNGGPLVTAGGLIFVAATTDDQLRAIDIHSGKTLWQTTLPAGGQTTAMTYEVEGRQYIVIAPGGHHFMETEIGDYIIAYALPKGS